MPTLPISYFYFSWWQLGFTTQHLKYKWCDVKGYIEIYRSDRFATSKRDFKILVPEDFQFRKAAETHHTEPPQVRGWLEGGAACLDVEVKLYRARGSVEQADGGGLWVPIA